jgi:hypothetical protein
MYLHRDLTVKLKDTESPFRAMNDEKGEKKKSQLAISNWQKAKTGLAIRRNVINRVSALKSGSYLFIILHT